MPNMRRMLIPSFLMLSPVWAQQGTSSGDDALVGILGLLIIFGLGGLVIWGVRREFAQRQSSPRPGRLYAPGHPRISYTDEQAFTPTPENWALAAGVHHRLWYERPVDGLVDTEGRPSYKRFLEETWQVEKRDDLLKHLMHLFFRGPREALIGLQKLDPKLPQDDPFGFDLVRFVNLTTAGVTMGLITLDEGRVLMLHGARALQAHLSGWSQITASYMAGYDLDRVEKSIELNDDNKRRRRAVMQAFRLLENSSKSPWKKIPWNLALPEPEQNDFFEQTARRFVLEAILP